MKPQTDVSHYDEEYYQRRRLYSLAVQAELLAGLGPRRVLEIGPGRGVFAALYRQLCRAAVLTLDVDPTLRPGVIGSVLALPFGGAAFDACACFQMLEHLPFGSFAAALREMRRVAPSSTVISLPDCTLALTLRLGLRNPRKDGWVAAWSLQPPWLCLRRFKNVPNTAGHYWEIGRKGTPLTVVRAAIAEAGWTIARELRTAENAYHRFFVLR